MVENVYHFELMAKGGFWKVVSMRSEFRSERLYEKLTIDNVELRYGREKIIKTLFRGRGS